MFCKIFFKNYFACIAKYLHLHIERYLVLSLFMVHVIESFIHLGTYVPKHKYRSFCSQLNLE